MRCHLTKKVDVSSLVVTVEFLTGWPNSDLNLEEQVSATRFSISSPEDKAELKEGVVLQPNEGQELEVEVSEKRMGP